MWLNNNFSKLISGIFICLLGLVSLPSLAQTISGKSTSINVKVNNPKAVEKSLKPTIKWIYPSDDQEILREEFTNLKLGINSQSPLVKVTVILNDEIIKTYDSFEDPAQPSGYLFDAWIEQPIVLAEGANNIVLVVQNELGALQHKRKLEVQVKPSQRKDYALIIGIDEYNAWSNLNGPIRDAERLARELEFKGFQIDLVRDATTFDILDKLQEYAKKDYGPHDQLLVYFAGYGFYDVEQGTGHLVCKNSIKEEKVNVTYLSYEVLQSILNNIPVPHIFMLMDAVKGRGEALPLARNHPLIVKKGAPGPSQVDRTGTTRIGLLSGMEDYKWNASYGDGSPLSKAFISYMNKPVSHQFSWLELIEEFEKLHPKPIYVEFGDHNSGNRFTFQPREGR